MSNHRGCRKPEGFPAGRLLICFVCQHEIPTHEEGVPNLAAVSAFQVSGFWQNRSAAQKSRTLSLPNFGFPETVSGTCVAQCRAWGDH